MLSIRNQNRLNELEAAREKHEEALAELVKSLDAMSEKMAELRAMLDARRKPGRPKKIREEAH